MKSEAIILDDSSSWYMDNKIEILLGSQKNINSINVDNYETIELTNNESEINEFTVNDVVNATEQFNIERKDNPIYRIYGRIEYMSLLNGLKSDYDSLDDFFNPQKTGSIKNILNSFDFYLVAPSSEPTYNNITNTNEYKRTFKVIGDKNDFEIYNAGFSNNVYGEQTYAFSFKSDFDVSNLYDYFGLPITELFLYAQYKKVGTETMKYTRWSSSTGNPSKVTLNTTNQIVGDNLKTNSGIQIYDIIEYSKEEYLQEQVETQKFYIETPYIGLYGIEYHLEWSYNPFIPFKLRYLDSVLSTGKLTNIIESGTSLNIYEISATTSNFDVTKTLKQNLSETTTTITEWDDQTSIYYNWTPSSGILEFLNDGTYNINFKTQIYLSEGTDKYIAEIYLEENTGSGYIEIPNTKRKFQSTDLIEGVILEKEFNTGDKIRIRTRLIPNPNERKLEIMPDFATIIENEGRYVWRDIVPQGYTEPLTGVGVDYPFFNGKRYLFSSIILDVVPNLSDGFDEHPNTLAVFNEISFSDDATSIDITPLTELDDIGKPCQ